MLSGLTLTNNDSYFLQQIPVSLLCEDMYGYPAVVRMKPVGKLTFKFSPQDYAGTVRELVQGLVQEGATGRDEWDADHAWKKPSTRRKK